MAQLTCEQCGKIFNAKPSRHRRYCSRACHSKAKLLALPERFWAKADKSGDCWLWTGYTQPNGYGRAANGYHQSVLAHRLAYQLTYGPIPKRMLVCHNCDVRNCVRPEHLFLGSSTDNNRDASRKRHTASGEQHWNAKLTDAQVMALRERYRCGERASALARAFGISRSSVSLLIHRKTRIYT